MCIIVTRVVIQIQPHPARHIPSSPLLGSPPRTCPAADSNEFSINALIQLCQNHNAWPYFTSETINVTSNI